MESKWWMEACERGRRGIGGVRVAVYGSGGAPFHHAALVSHFGGSPVVRGAEEIRSGGLDDVDVIVFPGGGARAMAGMLDPLGVEGARAVREWVASGGMYIGSCAGSFLPARVGETYWRAHPEARELHMAPFDLANGSDSEWEGLTSPGVGRVRARLTAPAHWLGHGLPDTFELIHYNGPMFRVASEGRESGAMGVAEFATRTDDFTPSEEFLGAQGNEERLFDRCAAAGAFTAVASPYGDGNVVLFGSHPEFGFDTLQLGWGEGTWLFLNALLHQARRPRRKREGSQDNRAEPGPAASDLDSIAVELEALTGQLQDLTRADTGAWLEPGASPSFLGLSATELWSTALREGADTAERSAQYLHEVSRSADEAALRHHALWLDREVAADQDYGFMGLKQLVSRSRAAVERGAALLDDAPVPLDHAYDKLDSHPFQVVVGSYLSAVGLIASAALAATVVGLHAAPQLAPPTGPRLQDVPATPGD